MTQHFTVSDGIMGDHTITGNYKSPLDAVNAWLACHKDDFFSATGSLDFIDCLIVSDTADNSESYFVQRGFSGKMTLVPTKETGGKDADGLFMREKKEDQIMHAVEKLTDAVNYISRGTASTGPLGLEAISMAIEGEGLPPGQNCLSDAIRDSGNLIALSINNLVDAIDRIDKKICLPNPERSVAASNEVSNG